MTTPALTPGDPVRIAMTKWGDRPHWDFGATYLGSDVHGVWIGIPAGTVMNRPGKVYVAPTAQVGLVPGPGSDLERAWLATFHAVGGPVRVYVDMTTPPVWDGSTVHAVDLDLDVIEDPDGRVWVDDEDEFAEHQVTLGYPAEVIALATASRDRIRALLTARRGPFDGVAGDWHATLDRSCPTS